MKLYDAIAIRKSCRKFSTEPLNAAKLQAMEAAIASFDLLYEDVKLSYRFVKRTKGMFNVLAPHYLLISGTGDVREQEAAGFLFEQLMLWFATQGIGAVWLGGSKDTSKQLSAFDIIPIAFGTPEVVIHREIAEFKRKTIEEITNDPLDNAMHAVRLAPSGINLQPWYFQRENNVINVYEQILKGPLSLFYKLTAIDIGIALAHYAVALREKDIPFNFTRLNDDKSKKGYRLFGKIALI